MSKLAQSCYASTHNKGPILEVLRPRLERYYGQQLTPSTINVLEIASGTGEHAAYFTSNIPCLVFQPTEPMADMHRSIVAWTEDMKVPVSTVATAAASSSGQSIILPPVSLDVLAFDASRLPPTFTDGGSDVMININMIHITPLACTEALFSIARQCLKENGILMTYGPYRVNGDMVESNKQFDQSLKNRNAEWGVRDLEVVEGIALKEGIVLEEVCQMPVNNLCLFFRKRSS